MLMLLFWTTVGWVRSLHLLEEIRSAKKSILLDNWQVVNDNNDNDKADGLHSIDNAAAAYSLGYDLVDDRYGMVAQPSRLSAADPRRHPTSTRIDAR